MKSYIAAAFLGFLVMATFAEERYQSSSAEFLSDNSPTDEINSSVVGNSDGASGIYTTDACKYNIIM